MITVLFNVLSEICFRFLRFHYGIGNPFGKYKQYGRFSGQVSFPNEFDRPWWLIKRACPKGVDPIKWNCKKDFVVDPITFNACRVYRFRIYVDGHIYDNTNTLVR